MNYKTITIIIATIILGILFGSIIYYITKENKTLNSEINYDNTQRKQTQQTDSKEVKVGPNTKIILNTIYKNCGHEKEEILDTKEYINMNYENIKNKIENKNKKGESYKIEVFESNILIISKNINEMCQEHFVVTQKNGKVIVYYEEYNKEKELKNGRIFRNTQISTEYLTDLDRKALEEGIFVQGEKNLNSILENYK